MAGPTQITLINEKQSHAEAVVNSDLSWSAVCGVWAVMELSVQLSWVQVQNKLPQLSWNPVHTHKSS